MKKKNSSKEPISPREIAIVFAQDLMAMGEIFAPLREATQAYKQSYIDMGWSQEAAEAAAVQYHAVICNGVMNNGIGNE